MYDILLLMHIVITVAINVLDYKNNCWYAPYRNSRSCLDITIIFSSIIPVINIFLLIFEIKDARYIRKLKG